MNLGLMRTFMEVYRCGSLTAAAKRLGMSQPAVSGQVQALESEFGRPLFTRLARGVAPTPDADALARRVAPHIDALQAVLSETLEPADPFAQPLRLAGPAELTATTLVPCLADLVARGLELRITLGLTDDLLTALASGTHDLVVATSRPRSRALEAVPLADEEFVLVAAPAVAAALDRERLAADPVGALRGVPLVAYGEDLPVIRRYWRSEFGVPPAGRAAVVVGDLRAVAAAAVDGCGATVLPRYLCEPELADGRLVPLHQPALAPINTLYLVWRKGTGDHPHIAAARDHLLEHLPLR